MSHDLFESLIWIWIAMAILVFPIAIKIVAPYGRHTRHGWGALIDNKLGWMLYESPALILVPFYFFSGDAPKNAVVWIMFLCFTLHYVNRTILFPLRIRTKGKKVPLGIVISAFCFNLINGSIIGYFLGSVQNYSPDWVFDPRFLVGFGVFSVGMIINWYSDHLLINLRKPDEVGYKIPYGGFFRWISCPNHFGEIIEWVGFAIMLWTLPAVSFAIWTFCNLVPRTLNHHQWYLEKFPDYPKNRKAVFPFIL